MLGKGKKKKGSLDDPIRDCTSFSLGVILLLPSTHTHTRYIVCVCVCEWENGNSPFANSRRFAILRGGFCNPI